jgi:mono/diheme cytochrome c family protein
MTIRHERLQCLLALAACTISMSGCSQLQAIFATRPSENMPAYKPVDVQFGKQNWSPEQRAGFYHTAQGTELLPYKWFLALEQPKVKLFGTVPKFSDTAYLARFGFLPDAASPQNPDGLPVGFAKDTVVDPTSKTGETVEVVGLTCAACHTGQVEYQGKGIRIDGGSATIDLASFQTELGYAAAFADKIPFRFDRFARAVLGGNASADSKSKLRQEFEAFLNVGLAEKHAADAGKLYQAAGGFGRTDALGRIGNYVFGTELNNANLRVANSPANFPPLWYTSWFAWVQYNASIQQPMVRNIGEALGVRARVNLTDPAKLYRSTVNVKNLWEMEGLLAGPTAFTGLKSPAWPAEVFGPIDQVKAQKGAELYKQHCQHCHLPALDSPEIQDPKYWEVGLEGKHFLKLNVIPLDEIGTDPREASDWAQRTAVTDALGLGTVSAAVGLRAVTGKIRDMNYAALGLSAEQKMEWNGYRNDDVVAPLAYRARPLGGLWATPPFLHNGSVPSLYQMLLPADRRDKTFYVGSREFDPKNVGYSTAKFDGGFEFDTDQPGDPHPGNSNAGHEFRDTPGKGVIGPELSDDERWAIIEYLKTL